GPETALVAHRILSTVHEADEVTIVHVGKAVCLVEDLDRIAELVDDDPRQLVTEVAAIGANVEEKVARRGRGRARTVAERPERVQLRGPRPSGRKVFPGFGADRHDAAQAGTRVTAPDAAHERRHVRAYVADACGRPLARVHRQDQEDGARAGNRERRYLGLRHRQGQSYRPRVAMQRSAGCDATLGRWPTTQRIAALDPQQAVKADATFPLGAGSSGRRSQREFPFVTCSVCATAGARWLYRNRVLKVGRSGSAREQDVRP